MKFLTRTLPSFSLAWIITFTLASLFHSQYVVNQLVNVGIQVDLSDRLSMTASDWLGLLPTYGLIIAIALLIAFPIATFLSKRQPQWETALFILAGLTTMMVVLLALEAIMNINLIAGAREWGFYLQVLAGGIGGAAYIRFMMMQQN